MKNNFVRIISAILTLCIIIGCLGVLPISALTVPAADNYAKLGTKNDPEIKQVILNRDFEDGTVINNGCSFATAQSSDAFKLVNNGNNTFVRITSQGRHDYVTFELGAHAPASGSVVFQMDVMVEDNTKYSQGAVQLNPKVRGASSDTYQVLNFRANGGRTNLIPLNAPTGSTAYGMDAGEWYTVSIVWSYDSLDTVTCTVFNGAGATVQYIDRASEGAAGCTDVRPGQLRVGATATANGSWCMDNVIIYTTEQTDPYDAVNHTVLSIYKGSSFNNSADKYVDPDAFVGNYYLKVGVSNALSADNKKIAVSAPPFAYEGEIYIPYVTLRNLGFTSVSPNMLQVVNGVRCAALSDMYSLTGFYGVGSSMGLIALTKADTLVIEGMEELFVPIMQRFLFDNITTDLTNAGLFSIDNMVSLDHPYIFANQEKLDSLHEQYVTPTDETLKSYLDALVKTAESNYTGYAKITNGEYVELKNQNIAVIPYISGYGYDVGGRQGDSSGHATRILNLAVGYQITRNENYAKLAYDYAITLGKWEHWGPGHFLNVADAAAPYAVAYDWLYDIWVDLGLDVSAIEEILFTHMILPAYYSKHDNNCPWYDPVVSSGWNYHSRTNNWNTVCHAGVLMASLALIGLETEVAGTMIDINIDGVYNPTTPTYAGTSGTITRADGKSFKTDQTGLSVYKDYSEYLINGLLFDLPYYGLGQYVPDGSYIESNGYWSYGTNNLYEVTAALSSATGSDWGILDAWGMDKTAYFALNTQSGDYQSWNYHDSGSVGAQDTSWFQYLGTDDGISDKTLAGIRKHILSVGGSSPTLYDAIYYMSDEEIGEWTMPDLQYHMKGIDGYVIRDSWDKGSIYAGIMGNSNNVSHGQVDSGSFVYYSNGVRWFCDVGTENYNSFGFWGGTTRYTYYKMNAEGNNTLILTSRQDTVSYGQLLQGFGNMNKTYDNEYGAYTLIDNTSVYGTYALKAYRGMLFTNDRKTLVLQDEVEFVNPESVAWIGHTMSDVIISVDGKTAYMYEDGKVLKVTLIDQNNLGLKFELTDTYDFLLDCTVGPNFSTDNGGQPENDRSAYKRLIVKCENVTSLKLAVVIEEVAVGETMNTDIGYEWCDMDKWVPTSDGRAENRELGAFDFDSADIGSVESAGNLSVEEFLIGSNTAASVFFNEESDKGYVSFVAKANKVAYGSMGKGFAVAEFDLSTSSFIPTNLSVGVMTNGGTLTTCPIGELCTIAASKWVRVAVVLDMSALTAYYFIDGTLIYSDNYPLISYENLALSFTSSNSQDTSGNLLVDNIRLRSFTEGYTGLTDSLQRGSLASWTDATEEKRTVETSSPVATITLTDDDIDTPIVDIPLSSVTVYTQKATMKRVIEIYSFSDIEKYLTADATVTLLADNKFVTLNINVPCTVITNGYYFGAVSEDYIAVEENGTLTYKTGSIDVKWVLDGATIIEKYTGSVPAQYKGSLSSKLYEASNADGTYRYYTKESWSATAGGDKLAREDMIVTSKNAVFYLTETPYDGAFVTVKGSTLTGYTDGASFFTSAILNGSFDRVSLTNDFSYDSTEISDSYSMTKNFNLYLNGYTIYYSTTTSSDHMLTTSSATNTVSVYGPGSINSDSTTANIVYQNGNFYAENVTFVAPRAITDARYDLGHYKNCNIIITKNASALGVTNRNNAVTNSARMPKLLVDGCNIEILVSSSTTAALSITANASIEITGGSSVNIASGNGYLFRLSNSYVAQDPNYDYANGVNYMKAFIGSVSYNCSGLYINATSDTSGAIYDMADKIFYSAGACFKEYPDVSKIDSGLIIARCDNPIYPYIVSSKSDIATVSWKIGSQSITEYWISGSIPRPDSAATKALVSANPPASGNKYTFAAERVIAGASYTLDATEIKDFDIYLNLTLESGFTVNIYVPTKIDGVTFTSYVIDGTEYSISDTVAVNIDGAVYYKIEKSDLAPNKSAGQILVSLIGKSNNNPISITLAVSIADYASKILESNTQSDEAKALMANVLKYIVAAYKYSGDDASSEYNSIYTVYKDYAPMATASVVKRQNASLSAISDGIRGASLNLGGCPNYRFAIQPGYNGLITLSYTVTDPKGNESTLTTSFDVVDGKWCGSEYIEIERRAYDLVYDIVITTASGEAVYNLATYYHNAATELGDLTELLNALYAYCETARIYKNTLDTN